jgi:hypothetical protein
MSNLEPTYEDNAKRAKKTLFKYRIDRPGSKHFRSERVTKHGVESRELVMYGGPGTGGIREVWFTEDDAARHSHMRLVRLYEDKPIEIQTDEEETEESNETTVSHVKIPADWDTLSKRARIDIACQISGRQNIKKVDEADEIISAEIDRRNGE